MNLPSFQNCLSLLPRMLGHPSLFFIFLGFFGVRLSHRKDRGLKVRARFLPDRSEEKIVSFGLRSNVDWLEICLS